MDLYENLVKFVLMKSINKWHQKNCKRFCRTSRNLLKSLKSLLFINLVLRVTFFSCMIFWIMIVFLITRLDSVIFSELNLVQTFSRRKWILCIRFTDKKFKIYNMMTQGMIFPCFKSRSFVESFHSKKLDFWLPWLLSSDLFCWICRKK